MIPPAEAALYEIFAQLGISYTRYEHSAVFTVQQASLLDDQIPGTHCKNIFLRNKNGKQHFLIILHALKPLDLKQLAKQISSSSLQLASEERLLRYLGVRPGAVGPFGLIYDQNKEVEVLIAEDLLAADLLKFHPNVNTASITVTPSDLMKFLAWHANKLRILPSNPPVDSAAAGV